jgi:alkylation response protein AidB-like acyl-CoA dehydrogenase
MTRKDATYVLDSRELDIRSNFRRWLLKNLPTPPERRNWFADDLDTRYAAWRSWQKKLYDNGWMGLSWPLEYGGKQLSLTADFIIGDELARHRAPYSGNWISLAAIAQALLNFGTPEQCRRHLARIACGDESWCLGVTEPQSGSNVMETQTFAELVGSEFVINGKKIWTTHSPRADYCLLLVKTDRHRSPEWSLTKLIVDLRLPGVQVKPLRQLHGDENYGEVTFTNVRVPKSAIVGALNGGWIVQATTWLQESVPPFDVPHRLGLRSVAQDVRGLSKSKLIQEEQLIAETLMDGEAVRLLSYRALKLMAGRSRKALPAAAPLVKIAFTETSQKITTLGLKLSSSESQVAWANRPDSWLHRHISARSNTIARAPSEIHRNFLARHYLELPR